MMRFLVRFVNALTMYPLQRFSVVLRTVMAFCCENVCICEGDIINTPASSDALHFPRFLQAIGFHFSCKMMAFCALIRASF